MKIRVCRYRWIFWFMNEYKNVPMNENKIIYENREYELKKIHKIYFLTLKYAFPFILIIFTINRYDFEISMNKVFEIIFAVLGLKFYKNEIYLLALFSLAIIASFALENISLVAFSTKYFFCFLILKMFLIDIKYTKAYAIFKNNKTLSYLTCEDKK